MDFEWWVPKIFNDDSEKDYINHCCIGGDEVLEQLKPEIASAMEIAADEVKVFQEDWGWAMEFLKDEVFYLLAVNNSEFSENGKTLFNWYTQATKKAKDLFLDKTIDAAAEYKKFSEIVLHSAQKNGFETI